jgi:hypothetical protein
MWLRFRTSYPICRLHAPVSVLGSSTSSKVGRGFTGRESRSSALRQFSSVSSSPQFGQ